jgi:hypothetical protein
MRMKLSARNPAPGTERGPIWAHSAGHRRHRRRGGLRAPRTEHIFISVSAESQAGP